MTNHDDDVTEGDVTEGDGTEGDGTAADGTATDGAGETGGGQVVRVDFGKKRAKAADKGTSKQLQPSRPRADELPPTAPEKLRAFARMIERGMVMVTLDGRKAGVVVPGKLSSELQLNLNFSLRFGLADFAYDDVGVRASLSFGGTPFACDVPWTAVYAMRSHVDNEMALWPEDLPLELVARIPREARPTGTPDVPGEKTAGDKGADGNKAGPRATRPSPTTDVTTTERTTPTPGKILRLVRDKPDADA